MSEETDWTVELETVAALLLQGAHPWQIAATMESVGSEQDARQLIAQVRELWGRDATGGIDPALDQGLAQLKRVQMLAWESWQKKKDPRTLKLIQETEGQILETQELIRQCLADAETAGAIARLPPWVSVYLAAWGTKREDGKRVTVSWAAELAGTTDSTVRSLRKRSPRFRRMEYMARHAEAEEIASLVQAGLRGNAGVIFEAFMRLIKNGNPQATLRAVDWLQDKPAIAFLVAAMNDEQLQARYQELLDRINRLRTRIEGHQNGSAGSGGDASADADNAT